MLGAVCTSGQDERLHKSEKEAKARLYGWLNTDVRRQ